MKRRQFLDVLTRTRSGLAAGDTRQCVNGATCRRLAWRMFSSSLLGARAGKPGQNGDQMIPGAWTWFNDPRAIAIDGTVYAGAVSASGDVQVGASSSAVALH